MASNTHLVQQLYDAFNARKMETVLSMLAEDVIWANGMHGGHVHGREAVRAYWSSQWQTIDPRVDPTDITPAEDGSVVVKVHQVVRDMQGNLLLEETVEHVFRLDGGLVRRFDIRSASQLSSLVHELVL